jgi:murein DD-endopeptidase MepM/ murein hydrolase activator NlpD
MLMLPPERLDEFAAPRRGFWRRHGWWLIPLLVVDGLVLVWWMGRGEREPVVMEASQVVEPALPVVEVPPPPPPGNRFVLPTPQPTLTDTNVPGVFMPTASGRLESALYGSVRTTKQGSRYLASFHEGLDIGPTGRDRKQMPLDSVFAAAEGRVVYANRVAGNSNYGRYVVLVHDDPVGEIYSLYAHLEEVDAAMRPGVAVAAGDRVGRMGHSASTGIPVVRAHLHFEVGVINNDRFLRWFRAQKLKPDHGNFHGYNLTGINPQDIYAALEQRPVFSMLDYLTTLPPAFTITVRHGRVPDYFVRYAGLWSGEASTGGAVTMTVSEGGVPLSGRAATEEERKALAGRKHEVVAVDEAVLGRNGLRLVTRGSKGWTLGRNGERWLEILLYQ